MEKEEKRTERFSQCCLEVCEREYVFMVPQEIAPEQLQTKLSGLLSEFGLINIDRYDMEATFGNLEKIGVGTAECQDEEKLSDATLSALALALEGIGKEVPAKLLLFFEGDLGICSMYDALEGIQKRFMERPNIIFGYYYREDVDGDLPAKVLILVG